MSTINIIIHRDEGGEVGAVQGSNGRLRYICCRTTIHATFAIVDPRALAWKFVHKAVVPLLASTKKSRTVVTTVCAKLRARAKRKKSQYTA